MDEPSVPLSPQALAALLQRVTMLEASEAMTEAERDAAEAALCQRTDELVETSHRLATLVQRYHALFALAPDGYLVTDAAGVIAEANHAATCLLGSSPEELLGTPLIVYVAQADHQAFQTQLGRLMRQERVQDWELTFAPPGARPFPADVTVTVGHVAHEARTTLHWLLRDLTARRQQEAERRRTETLTLLGTLATSVAHEIRNPLASIFLHADLLDEDIQTLPEALRAPMQETLGAMQTGCTRLQAIIEDYLSLARLPSLQSVSADFGAFLEAFTQELRPLSAARGITFSLEGVADLGAAVFHPSTLRRALVNLAQNALEAMTEGGTLTLRGERTGTHLTVRVQDTGHGIPPEELPLLFTPLRTTKPQGTGLGLFVVQQIVEAHGGTLAVESALGVGTTFTLTLPCHVATPSPTP
jgi:two-component system sensor histidine kinase HydH